MQQNRLTSNNLNVRHNHVIVSIKNFPRIVNINFISAHNNEPPFKELRGFEVVRSRSYDNFRCCGFERVRSGSDDEYRCCHEFYPRGCCYGQECPLYGSIDGDYHVAWWDDEQYFFHSKPLVSEEEWMQFKREILHIYAEHNARRAALRWLIEINPNRSFIGMFGSARKAISSFIYRSRCDPLRDPDRLLRCLQCFICIVLVIPFGYFFLLICMVDIALLLICAMVDLLLFPRFILFRECHYAFLMSVMTANPDLDPVLVEESLVQQLRQLADRMNRDHPGVNCRFISTLESIESKNRIDYYEVFQMQFLK